MSNSIRIGDRKIGEGHPCYVIAEIGINHNGDLRLAQEMVRRAAEAKCDAVKFQKRLPDVCVPVAQRDLPRETPWGVMTYLEYKRRIEFDREDFEAIDACCKSHGIDWFASCWDIESVEFIEEFGPPCHKIASASLTDEPLLRRLRETGRPLLLSTGMSSLDEIDRAVQILGPDHLALMHCTSTYPAPLDELNLRAIESLRKRFGVPVGYSGHEVGLQTTLAAVVLGAVVVERHLTLDRAMWGTDQAASVEPQGMRRLVRDIRAVERAMGDGVKRIWPSEELIRNKLRKV